jgi:hypothetical protein
MRKLLFLAVLVVATPIHASWAQVPLEVLVDDADVIVVGKVTKVRDGGFFTLGPNKFDHLVKQDVAVVEISAILKGSPRFGKPKEVHIGQSGLEKVTSADIRFRPGQRGIWLLTKVPGTDKVVVMKGDILVPDPDRNVYWAKHPSQFQTEKEEKKLTALIEARAKLSGGKAVNDLVARAEVVQQKPEKGPAYMEVRFSLKNVSDKPITICDYVGNQPLKVQWIGPDGKTLRSDHYGWLRFADIAGLNRSNFVTIPAGGVRRIGPQGENSGIIFQPTPEKPLRFGNVSQPGKHRVTITYVNHQDGMKFDVQNVWTGAVTANEVAFVVK